MQHVHVTALCLCSTCRVRLACRVHSMASRELSWGWRRTCDSSRRLAQGYDPGMPAECALSASGPNVPHSQGPHLQDLLQQRSTQSSPAGSPLARDETWSQTVMVDHHSQRDSTLQFDLHITELVGQLECFEAPHLPGPRNASAGARSKYHGPVYG